VSNLRGLYTALAAVDVTFAKEDTASITVSAFDVSAIPNSIPSEILPARFLLPVNGRGEGLEAVWMAANVTSAEIVWEITDLMLWQPVAQGRGLIDVAADLTRYIDDFELTFRAQRLITSGFDIMTMRFTPDVFDFPAGGDTSYFGVETIMTIREII